MTLLVILSIQNHTKHDPQGSLCQNNSEEDQYLASPSLGDQFATNVENDEKSNNAVATIKRLFLNIEHESSYNSLTKKVMHETCEFFMHFVRYMSSKNWVALHRINTGLRLF